MICFWVGQDGDEDEVRGYHDALRLIHEQAGEIPVSEETILKFHELSRGQIWDAGKYKEKNIDITRKYPDGRQRVPFETVPADQTAKAMSEMIELWTRGLQERWVHPLVLLTALHLDFFCIHPFRDGNGRVSRLLLLLTGRLRKAIKKINLDDEGKPWLDDNRVNEVVAG